MDLDIVIYPVYGVDGCIRAPPSKSYTHRYLFLALLSEGITRIINPLVSGDTMASLRAIRCFGVDGDFGEIIGRGSPAEPSEEIDCGRSGTTARFSMSIACLVDGYTYLTGSEQLCRRPMKPLIDALRCMGVEIIDDGGRLPLRVRGGNIKRRVVEISGNVSSQYISSLLFLGVKEGIDIHVLDDAVSRGYIDLTLNVLEEAGVNFYRDGYRFFHVDPMDIGGKRYEVPGDYSLVSFFIVAAAINGRIRILGLDRRVVQPDRRLLDIVREMGGVVKWSHGVLEVSSSPLEGIEISLRSSPDLLPVVSVLAAFADGETRIYGVEHARYKESDRIFSTSLNLRRMGVDVEEYSDGLIIKGGSPKGGVFYSYGDHRVAMAFIIASLFLDRPSLIRDVGCIWDSYPYFLGDFSGVGGRFELV